MNFTKVDKCFYRKIYCYSNKGLYHSLNLSNQQQTPINQTLLPY